MGKQLSLSHTHLPAWPWLHPQGSSLLPWIISVRVSSPTAGSLCFLWPECCVDHTFTFTSLNCRMWAGKDQRKKKSPAYIVRASQAQWQPCREAVLAARLHSRETDRIQSVPVGLMAASPEDPMLQKLLASAIPGVVQNKGVEGNGELQPCSCRAVPYGARSILGVNGTENFSASPSLPQQI